MLTTTTKIPYLFSSLYLFDLDILCVSVDLDTGSSLGQINHDSKIDWLEVYIFIIQGYLRKW